MEKSAITDLVTMVTYKDKLGLNNDQLNKIKDIMQNNIGFLDEAKQYEVKGVFEKRGLHIDLPLNLSVNREDQFDDEGFEDEEEEKEDENTQAENLLQRLANASTVNDVTDISNLLNGIIPNVTNDNLYNSIIENNSPRALALRYYAIFKNAKKTKNKSEEDASMEHLNELLPEIRALDNGLYKTIASDIGYDEGDTDSVYGSQDISDEISKFEKQARYFKQIPRQVKEQNKPNWNEITGNWTIENSDNINLVHDAQLLLAFNPPDYQRDKIVKFIEYNRTNRKAEDAKKKAAATTKKKVNKY